MSQQLITGENKTSNFDLSINRQHLAIKITHEFLFIQEIYLFTTPIIY